MLHRVIIDIEFAVDETRFKIARLTSEPTVISDVTEAAVREVIANRLVQIDWTTHGLTPQRSTVTTRLSGVDGHFVELVLPAELGVVAT